MRLEIEDDEPATLDHGGMAPLWHAFIGVMSVGIIEVSGGGCESLDGEIRGVRASLHGGGSSEFPRRRVLCFAVGSARGGREVDVAGGTHCGQWTLGICAPVGEAQSEKRGTRYLT